MTLPDSLLGELGLRVGWGHVDAPFVLHHLDVGLIKTKHQIKSRLMEKDDRLPEPSEKDSVLIRVEVAYATPERQLILPLDVPEGITVYEAAERSNIIKHFPEIVLEQASMGVFGKLEKNPKQRVLRHQERVEIYRPLLIDPKEVRKRRAAQAREPKAPG